MDRNLLNIPFHEFHSHLDPLIPYSAINKTSLSDLLFFHIFTLVENQPSKQRLKHKRPLLKKNIQNLFLFNKL